MRGQENRVKVSAFSDLTLEVIQHHYLTLVTRESKPTQICSQEQTHEPMIMSKEISSLDLNLPYPVKVINKKCWSQRMQ